VLLGQAEHEKNDGQSKRVSVDLWTQ